MEPYKVDKPKAILIGVVVAAVAVGAVLWAIVGRADPTEMLASKAPERQDRGISALASQIDSPEGVRRLEQAVRHKDSAVARSALQAVVPRRDPVKPLKGPLLEVVKKAAEDPRQEVSITAIQVLEATTPPAPEDEEVPEHLLKQFTTAKSPHLRAAAGAALGTLQYWQAMDALLAALDDESVIVRGAAGMAVREIIGLDYGYRADAPESQRDAVASRIRQQWKLQLPFHMDYVNRIRERRKANP